MKKLLKSVLCLLIILGFITGCSSFDSTLNDNVKNNLEEVFQKIKGEASINKYTIYGRFFNLQGEINTPVDNLILLLKNQEFESEYNIDLKIENGKTYFQTSEIINKGINLDKISTGDYIFLLKATYHDESVYYTLKNKTSYQDLVYYTTTKNNKNNKIEIAFSHFNNYNYLYLDCKEVNLPDDIYDIVIDPGHGGVDVGASKNGYYESHINLDYAKKLKKALEGIGLKVKLTRNDDISVANYGEAGRVSIPYKTKAKLLLSIHQNSSLKNVFEGGIEIYVGSNTDITFANSIIQNIKKYTSSPISSNVSNKIASGVYRRMLSQNDLNDIYEDAKKKGYKPYEKATTNSTYYYIIRETGGIITNAYVDSRNKEKDYNIYYNSNYGTEAYLLELGYINSNSNLKIILNEKDNFIRAICESVKEYLEI